MIHSVTLMKYQKYPSKLTLLRILGADSTSFTYGEVENGYPFGNNAVIFWPFSTYVAVIISGCTKIVIGLGTSVSPPPPITLGTQNPVYINFFKSWLLCVADHIISVSENVFLPFPLSEQVFFTISLSEKATIDK